MTTGFIERLRVRPALRRVFRRRDMFSAAYAGMVTGRRTDSRGGGEARPLSLPMLVMSGGWFAVSFRWRVMRWRDANATRRLRFGDDAVGRLYEVSVRRAWGNVSVIGGFSCE